MHAMCLSTRPGICIDSFVSSKGQLCYLIIHRAGLVPLKYHCTMSDQSYSRSPIHRHLAAIHFCDFAISQGHLARRGGRNAIVTPGPEIGRA